MHKLIAEYVVDLLQNANVKPDVIQNNNNNEDNAPRPNGFCLSDPIWLNANFLKNVGESRLLALQNFLTIELDRLNNINTEYQKATQGRPPMFIRDARNAKAPQDQINPGAPEVLAISLVQRMLSCYRGVQYALEKQANTDAIQKALLEQLQLAILETGKHFDQVVSNRLDFCTIEKDFNTQAIHALGQAGLSTQIYSPKHDIKLLSFYRFLASTLDPAAGMCTVTSYRLPFEKKSGDPHALVVQTATPITQKTDAQILALQTYTVPGPYAFQQAYQIFKDRIQNQYTMLGAQERKWIAPTLKCAYVTDCVIWNTKDQTTQRSALGTRSGSLVYTCNGLSDPLVQQHTQDNIAQLQYYTENRSIHFTLLNTDSHHNNQYIIVRNLKRACARMKQHISCVPVNFEGMFRSDDIDPLIRQQLALRSSIASNKQCNENAAAIADKANSNMHNHTSCSSGHNRTGTIEFLRLRNWLCGALTHDEHSAETLLATGLHDNRLTALHLPGSSGLKDESHVWGLFAQDTDRALYTPTADTKISSPAHSALIQERYAQRLAVAQDDLQQLYKRVIHFAHHRAITQFAIGVKDQLRIALGEAPTDLVNIDHARAILHQIVYAYEHADHLDQVRQQQLLDSATQLSKRSKKANIITAVSLFLAAVLVIAGTLLIIPSGGSSLLLTTVGLSALIAFQAKIIATVAIMAAFFSTTGLLSFFKWRNTAPFDSGQAFVQHLNAKA